MKVCVKEPIVISLLALWVMMLGHDSYAAVIISKKRRLVKIDEGLAAGFKKKDKVCALNDEGKKVACGVVVVSKKNAAYVRFSKKRINVLKKGMVVVFKDQKKKELLEGNQEVKKHEVKTYDIGRSIRGAYLFTAMAPSVYNSISYVTIETNGEKLPSLWEKNSEEKMIFVWGFLSFSLRLSPSLALETGFRYRSYSGLEAQGFYDSDSIDYSLLVTGSALGLFSDLYFFDLAFLKDIMHYRLGMGLDVDLSTLKFSAKTIANDANPTSTEFASAKSTLGVASVRLVNQFAFFIMGPLGGSLDINFLVPVASFNQKFSGYVADQDAERLAAGKDAAVDDLKDALGHKKSSFGLEIALSTFLSF